MIFVFTFISPGHAKKTMADLVALMDMGGSYATYREEFRKGLASPPCIPYMYSLPPPPKLSLLPDLLISLSYTEGWRCPISPS